MDSILVQDWTVLASGAAGGTITQSEPNWLDLSAYRDVVAWLEVKRVSAAGLSISYQTSPSKDDTTSLTQFVNMAQLTGIATGVTVTPMLQDPATGIGANSFPLSRWFRWQLGLSPGPWDINFRIWLAANRPGRAHANRNAAAARQ